MQRPTTIHRKNLLAKLLMLLCILSYAAIPKKALGKNPVITIAGDWDFAPYEFVNLKGQPDGYHVEVLHTILKKLNIPHEFEMKSRRQGVRAFRNQETDLIVDYRGRYNNEQYFRTRTSLGFYQMMVAHRQDMPPISKAEQLKEVGSLIANGNNDSIAHSALGPLADSLNIEYHTAREALSGITDGEFDYFIWGEAPLKWKIKEYNLQGISIDPLDIPAFEIHIVGYDKKLIDEIDSQFARMQQSGELDHIYDKWFHPENIKEESVSLFIIVSLAILLLTVFVAFIYWMVRKKVKSALERNEDLESMMHQALNMGKYAVMINNLRRNRVTNHHGDILPKEGITMKEMMERIHPDDRKAITDLNAHSDEPIPFTVRWNNGTPEAPDWHNVSGYSYPEFDEYHRPVNFIITSQDITEEEQKERMEREMANRYRKMFDSSLLGISFYNKNGYVIDLNDKMRELCCITPENEKFFRETSFFDLSLVQDDFDPSSRDIFHACQHMYYPEQDLDKYIEYIINSVFDENGDTMYFVITARDITNERSMYLELKQQNLALQEATATNSRYENEMRELLSNCDMFVWHVDMESRIIYFSRSLHSDEFTETLEEYVNGMYEDHRLQAIENIRNIQAFKQPFHVIHHFHYTPVTKKAAWFSISGMPIFDDSGNVESLFGIVRDVTELMEAQERLKEETARAENSAMLKATFLANMTHEIRTPLNAIVGFSDLLHMVSTTEERKEFVRIIRNNCDMLMRLINDIFEASNMDVKPLEIKPEQVDFAQFFSVISQSLSQRVQNPAVEFIAENPYSSFVTVLDKGRMQQVITNFVTNAVKYTRQGHIRIGYMTTPLSAEHFAPNSTQDTVSANSTFQTILSNLSQRRAGAGFEGVLIYCEDTGTGIPKEKQKRVFDRFVKLNDFVQGTGLGLNICKAIAERSNGHIGLESEGEGHGCLFWIWVPCPIINYEPADQ